MIAVGEPLHHTGGQVVAGRIRAAAPAGLPVVGREDLVDVLPFGRAVFVHHIEKCVFGGRELEGPFGNVFCEDFFLSGGGIHGQEPCPGDFLAGEIVFAGAGHPVEALARPGENPSGGGLAYRAEALRPAAFPGGRVGGDQPAAVGRKRHAGDAGPQQDVFHPVAVAAVFPQGEDAFFRRFKGDVQRRFLPIFQ